MDLTRRDQRWTLVDDVASGRITRERFDHRGHLALAVELCADHGPSEALRRMRRLLKQALSAVGAGEGRYHETVTRAWLELVGATFRARGCEPHGGETVSDAVRDEVYACLSTAAPSDALLSSYRVETLWSEAARTAWVPPDLGPIEAPWDGQISLRWATSDELDLVRALFGSYQRELGVDLCFQGFDEELRTLPGAYAPPAGRLLLAWREGRVVGCGALRPKGENVELKRVYVTPETRGTGLGRRISLALLGAARDAGYARIVLDTLDRLEAACGLYESLGFARCEPYVFNPEPDVRYYARSL